MQRICKFSSGIPLNKTMRQISILFFCFLFLFQSKIQGQNFTQSDTLRGSITPERAWWDLQHYDLEVTLLINNKSLVGKNTISYRALAAYDTKDTAERSSLDTKSALMQIDLQGPMKIDSVLQNGQRLSFTNQGPAHFIELIPKQELDTISQVTSDDHTSEIQSPQ